MLLVTVSAAGQDFAGSKPILDSMPRAVTSTATPRWHAEVVAEYPHDVWAFTEGLLLHDGRLIESTGYNGLSSLRRVEVETGLVTEAIQMRKEDFGEGLAVAGDRIVQLTWKQHIALIYELKPFKRIGEFNYSGEGWGLCFNGRDFVMSDGSDKLTLRDRKTFAVRSTISVTVDGQPKSYLNELECVGDLVYANVYPTNSILEIGRNGVVTKIIDLADLLTQQEQGCLGNGVPKANGAAVLNGIAHDPADGTFLVTGKLWPKVFRVRFVP